nr:hypothetical protein [Curtobacterium flaccumfaciens]
MLPRSRTLWRSLVLIVMVVALALASIVAMSPPRAEAAGVCGTACDDISADPATLAKQLGGFVTAGTFTATANGAGDTNDLYRNEILPIANGNPTPGCQLDTRVLQTLVIVTKKFGSLRVNDLNRRCPTMTHPVSCASNESSLHCIDPSVAIDFGSVGGSTVQGPDARTHELLDFLDTFVPKGTQAGQSQCRPTWSFTNITRQFVDTCNHQHVDFSNVTSPLSISPSSYSNGTAVAVRANTGTLWTWTGSAGTPGFAANSGRQIQDGTSPALARDGSNAAAAYVDPSGTLWTWKGKAGTTGTAASAGVGVKPGTSPDIVSLGDGNFAVAFQANTGDLWTWKGTAGSTGYAQSTGQGMKDGTNPSITTVGSGVSVAYQAESGGLWTWYGPAATTGTAKSAGLGMKDGTSPAITRVNGSTVAVSAQANTGKLWVWSGTPRTTGLAVQTAVGMKAGTSPSITLVGSELAVAAQANTGDLWTWRGAPGDAGFAHSADVGMKTDTSPSAVTEGDHLAVAVQANTGSLWTWTGDAGTDGFASAGNVGMRNDPGIG